MVHEPLVELVVAGHEGGDRGLGLPAGPAGLLPHRGDGAREAVEHAGVEATDVDAELEGGGGHDAAERTAEQLAFDLAPLGAEVAAAVGPHGVGQVGPESALDVGGHQLGALAAPAEGDGAMAPGDRARS